MKRTPWLAWLLVASACASTSPVAIRAGEVCFHCRRTITDTAMAAEVISPAGYAFKFSSVACLSEYLREHPGEATRAVFVTDFAKGRLLDAEDALYVKALADARVGAQDYYAFRVREMAQEFAQRRGSVVVAWNDVLADRTLQHAH